MIATTSTHVLTALDTARLQLRPAAREDADALWALWSDPQVRRFLWDDVAIGRDRALETVRECEALAPRGLGLWVVHLRSEPAPIGCAGLMPVAAAAEYYPPGATGVEPLIALSPAFWGRGYATEVLLALVEYARTTLRLDRLVAAVDAPNVPSNRLLARLGFQCVAETSGPRYRLRHYCRRLGRD